MAVGALARREQHVHADVLLLRAPPADVPELCESIERPRYVTPSDPQALADVPCPYGPELTVVQHCVQVEEDADRRAVQAGVFDCFGQQWGDHWIAASGSFVLI